MTGAPLLRGFAPGAPIGWRDGQSITWERFVASAAVLATRLPGDGYCVNLCEDRLNFLLGFAAALMARSTSLAPQSRAPEVINTLAKAYPGSVLITDGSDQTDSTFTRIDISDWPAGSETASVPEIPLDHEAALLFTSGSTGAPRPHLKSWLSLVRGAAAIRARLPIASGSTLLGAVPAQHMFGLETTVMLPLQSGCAVAAGCPLLPAEIAAALAALPSPRWLVVTPLHLRACLTASELLAPLAGVVSATAPLPAELALDVERRYGLPLFEIYGSTETGSLATRRPTQTAIFETLDGITLSNSSEATRAQGGHLMEPMTLNDVLELHDKTRFVLGGRTQDLIKIAGKRGSLAALNAELGRVPGVQDSAIWVPEDEGTEARLVAFVVAPGKNPHEILDHLRQRLDPVFLPRPLLLVDALPRNRLGKLTQESLRQLAAVHGHASPRQDAGEAQWQEVPAAHPALPFHFPGEPLVPGVWLLALVENAARERFGARLSVCGVAAARFRRVLRPAEPFRITLDRVATDRITFSVDAANACIAEGTLAVRERS